MESRRGLTDGKNSTAPQNRVCKLERLVTDFRQEVLKKSVSNAKHGSSVHLFMFNGGSRVARSGAISGAKRRPSCPGSLQHVAVAPAAADPPVAAAQLRTPLEWLDADRERAVDERCAVADSSARARAAVSARWSHRYAPTQCNAPKMEDSNVEGKRE